MKPNRPLYFTLHMNRLNSDVDKVSHLMETRYKRDMAVDGKALLSHNIEFEGRLLRQFRTSFRKQIETFGPKEGSKDIFGNEYFGFERYEFIEVTVSYDFQTFSSIRFLGTRRKKPARFAMYNIPVNVDATTLNIVSDIRNVSDSVEDFFSKISTLLSCRPGSFEEDTQIVEDIGSITSGALDSDVISSIGWHQFITDYFLPRAVVVPKSLLSKEDLEAIDQKYNGKLFKSGEELDNEFMDFLGLKSEMTRIANSNFEVNNSGKSAFFTDLDKQIDTLGGLYAHVFDKFTLGCLIQEALECVRPPLACKDILRELSVEVLQQRIALAFPRLPKVVEQINKIIESEKKKEAEQLKKQQEAEKRGGKLASITTADGKDAGVLSLTDKVLDSIETVIDIEAICDLRIPFQIPKIELPNFPTIDLMFDINVQLDTAILEALARALLELILGILRDLLDCRKLDNFIAGLLNGEIADDSGAYGDLAKLFTDPQSLGNDSNIADAFGGRWDNFVDQTSPLLEDIVKFNSTQAIGVAEQTLTISQITEGTAGVGGLKEVLKSGNFNELNGQMEITRNETGAKLDITKLISFTGPGSDEANAFISEIGAWQLSDDGNSFTLSRISDDRVTIIATMASQKAKLGNAAIDKVNSGTLANDVGENSGIDAVDNTATQSLEDTQVVREERMTGEELFAEIGRLFDTVISILSPTETINLLAGKASTETLNTVLAIAKIKHKRLMLFVGTVQKLAMLFEMFGRAAGLDTLRDKLLLITASPDANKKLVPVKPCPPFENVFDFRKELLARTLPDDEVIQIMDTLINSGKNRFNEIQDGLVKIRNGLSPMEVLEPLLCGGGKGPNGKRNPIVENTLNSTIGLMFDPSKMMFDREILKYPEAISTTKEKQTEIPRKAAMDNNLPIFNPGATDGNVFGSLQSLLGLGEDEEAEDKKSDRINPEFKRMVDSGFVPTKKTGDGKTDFEPDGDADKDYIEGEEPVYKKETFKKVAAAFKDGITFENDDISLDLNKKFKLTLRGSLDSQSPVMSFTPFKIATPEWIIEYVEKNRTLFNIRTSGQINSSIYGMVPFSENYKIENDDVAIEDGLRARILELSEDGSKVPSRQYIFKKIFSDKVLPNLTSKTQETKEQFHEMFEEKYESFIKATIKQVGNGFKRNRLLKKVPNNSLTSLAPEGVSLGSSNADDLIALNLINFSPIPTAKQRACGTDPHLLDFESIKRLVKNRFDKECEEQNSDGERIDGLSPRRGPINAAGFVGVVMAIVRLYSIEYILRALFVLDEFKFTRDFLEDDLLIDYITFRMQSDIKRLGYYDDFEREAKITYEKLVEDKVVEPYSIQGESIASVNSPEQQISSGETIVSFEIKSLVKNQMISAMKRISDIIGIDKTKESNLKSVFFEGLDTFDAFSDFGEPTDELPYTSANSRFLSESIPSSGKFILERYLKVKTPQHLVVNNIGIERTILKLEQDKSHCLTDVVNFKNWEEFVAGIVSKNSLINIKNKKIFDINDKNNSLFEQPWKIGLRLVYIPPEFGGKVSRAGLTTNKNKFKLTSEDGSASFSKLVDATIFDKKSYYVYDKQPPEPAFLSDDVEYFKQYNPIPIIEKEIEITDFIKLGDANKPEIFEKIFNSKYEKILKAQMIAETQLDVLIDYCLFSKKMLSLFMIHSTMVLNGEQMKFLFEGTKQELKKLFYSLQNLGDYTVQTDFEKNGGNAGEFQRKFNRIGDPAGPSGADAFYFWSTTPIQILRALAVMTDPNIFWADKIVGAAGSGFLAPKLVRAGSTVRLDGTSQMLTTTPGIVLDNEFKVLQTGEVVKLSNKKDGIGKPIIEYTTVALIDSINDGIVVLKTETLPDGSSGPALRSGDGFTGVLWDKGTNGPGPGINLDNFNDLFDKKSSGPVYPGEKINLPYGLASLALTPMQIFSTILGPLCMTMYNPFLPLGTEFLKFEPLIYQLPHFQIASAETSAATDLKEVGIDLKGAEGIVCDEKEDE